MPRRALGRPLVLAYGKYFLVPPAKLEQAERFLVRYETGGVFFARLLPVVRHLIGIPAGIVRMAPGPYAIWTVVGSAIWCAVLAVFGQQVLGDRPDLISNPTALLEALKSKSHLVAAAVLVLAILYVVVMRVTLNPAGGSGHAPHQLTPLRATPAERAPPPDPLRRIRVAKACPAGFPAIVGSSAKFGSSSSSFSPPASASAFLAAAPVRRSLPCSPARPGRSAVPSVDL